MVRYDKRTAERGAKYVEDRRGARRLPQTRRGKAVGGVASGGIGVVLLAVLLQMCTGGGSGLQLDTQTPFDSSTGALDSGPSETVDPDAETVEYMEFLMFDIQDTWDRYFDGAGLAYQTTSLVIFQDSVSTGCGQATSAVGPFYCPAPGDEKVYIDLDFYDDLTGRFGAPGDFAQAYVIAHEVGHHVQNITGISDAVREAQARDSANRNEYSIRQELQADCLAGVWAHSANQRLTEESGQPIIEAGDIEEGLGAAAAVGDDRIQAQATGQINPDTWTHGSAQQRVDWFTTGFETGDPEQCDTFAASNP